MKKITDYLLALILVLLPTYLVRFSIFGIPTTLLEILIYLTFLVWLISRGWKKLPRPHNTYYIILATFLFAGLLSVFISPDHRAAAGLFKAYFFDGFLMFLMVASCRDKNLLINALIFSGLWVSLQAIYQKITGQVTADNRVLGVFNENPNYLALYLAPIAVLGFGKFVQLVKLNKLGKLVPRIACSLLLATCYFTALAVSGSRGALLAVAAGILFVLFFTFRKKIIRVILIVLFLIGVITTVYAFRPIPNALNRAGQSSNIRALVWQVSWEMVKEKPILGYGLANFQNAFTQRMDGVPNFNEYISPMARYPHNLYLALWLETGIIGLISLMGLIGLIFLVFRQNKNYVTIAVAAAVFTILIYGFVDTPFFKNDLAILFWTLIALI